MIIFQRVATFEGPPEEVAPWALEVTGAVNERTHLDVSVWQGLFGRPIGSYAWSTVIDSLTSLEAAFDALGSDTAFAALLGKAQPWLREPAEDALLRVVHAAGGEYVRPHVGAYAEVTTAVPAEGRLAESGAWGVEISDVHADLTHSSVLFCTSEYATFGELRWMAMYDSAAAVDAAAEAIAKDEGYMARLDAAGGLFVEGLARRGLARRIG
jgi:hypothetical protein